MSASNRKHDQGRRSKYSWMSAALASLPLRDRLTVWLALQTHWQTQGGHTPLRPEDRDWPGRGIAELRIRPKLKVLARSKERRREVS